MIRMFMCFLQYVKILLFYSLYFASKYSNTNAYSKKAKISTTHYGTVFILKFFVVAT